MNATLFFNWVKKTAGLAQAKNLDTLMKRVREVVELCLEDSRRTPSLELVGIQRISV
jgi:hypothetical protein